MNSKLIKACLAGTAAIAVAAGGTTFAAWSDFSYIGDNSTAAGHLVLDTQSTGKVSNVGGQSIAPGEFRTIDFFLSSADLDGVPTADLSMKVLNLLDIENGCASNSEAVAEGSAVDPVDNTVCESNDTNGAIAGTGEFSDEAYVRVRHTDPLDASLIAWGSNQCTPPSTHPVGANNTVYDLQTLSTTPAPLGTLADGEGVCVRIDLGLDDAATNAVQGDVSEFDLQFDLVQTP